MDDENTTPLLTHLIELRNRLMKSLVALLIGVGVAYGFAEEIYRFLVAPLAAQGQQRLMYTGLTEAFVTYLKLALYAGTALASPVIAYQLYRFIAPGLYAHERGVFVLFLLASPVLFVAGSALAYYGIFPMAWQFFLSFQSAAVDGSPAIVLEARVAEYFTLVLQLTFAFGLCFQLPVVLMLLARTGLVTPLMLRTKRRHAIVLIFIVAAVVTPPDVFSQIALALPLMALYELSILGCVWLGQDRVQSSELGVQEN